MTLADQIAAARAGTTTPVQQPVQPVQQQQLMQQPAQSNAFVSATPPSIPGATTPGLPAQSGALVGGYGLPAQPLGGGNRLSTVRDALKTATVGSRRNELPVGTGTFLLKSGKFTVTEDGKYKISQFSFLCLVAGLDGNGITHGTPGYSGSVPFEAYDVGIFQDMSPKYSKSTLSKNLSALQACMGWTKDVLKAYQATDQGVDTLMSLLQGMFCTSMDNNTPTGQPSIFSNQVVIQLSTKTSIAEQKNAAGQPLYDAQGNKATKTYTNTYWDKKVPLADIPTMIGDEATIRAFGSQEAFIAAVNMEKQLLDIG